MLCLMFIHPNSTPPPLPPPSSRRQQHPEWSSSVFVCLFALFLLLFTQLFHDVQQERNCTGEFTPYYCPGMNLPWLALLLHAKNEQESICFQWFFDRNGTTFSSKLSIMTRTVLTSSLLPLLTKLSLHTPLRLGSRLTDTSAARITASSSRETRQPGCVSASPRLKSRHKCDLYWLIHETACPLLSLCARSCACCIAGVSNTNLLLVAHDRPRGLLALVQPAAVILPLNTIISFPPRNASNNLYWMSGGYICTSRSIKITLCQLLLTFFEQLACVSSHKVGQKLLRCSIQMSWCFILAGFLKHCFTEHLGQVIVCHICYYISFLYITNYILHHHYHFKIKISVNLI